MKKFLMAVAVSMVSVALISGCASSKKNADGSNGGVTSETTANGSSAAVDSSMNFSPSGSDSGTINGLQTVHFDFDSTNLTSGEQQKLEGNAEWLKTNADVNMLVEGHCDHKGSTEYNLSLGERRANAVKQMLVKLGVSAKRLKTTSFGKEKPVAQGDSAEADAQNRRANFVPSKN